MRIMVSIVCNAYNHEKYIAQCLDGFVSQITNFNFEVLVHDDASTDNTAVIIKEYRSKFPDIINPILQAENKGSQGINNWIVYQFPRARGKYIAICEGDDYWTDPYKLQKQVDLLQLYPSATMSVGLIETFYEHQNLRIPESPYIFNDFPLVYWKVANKRYFHTSTYVIRRDIVVSLSKKYPKLFSNDVSICFLLIDEGPFVLVNEVLSCYRVTQKGIYTSTNDIEKFISHYQLFKDFRKKYKLKRYLFFASWEYRMLLKIKENNIQNINVSYYLFVYLKILHKIYKYFSKNDA